jgi:hypothetical protein
VSQYPVAGYCQIGFKTIPRRRTFGARRQLRCFDIPSNLAKRGRDAPDPAFDDKILISAALLYLALRKVNLSDLASRINIASLGWIGMAIAVTFLQIFVGVLRWREISAECGAPLATRRRCASI